MKFNMFFVFCTFALFYRLSADILEYQIIKTFSGDHHHENDVKLGTLKINKNIQYDQITATIIPNFPALINEADTYLKTVVLQFVPIKVSDIKHENKKFKTSISEIMKQSHDQIIGVVVDLQLNVKAINFIQRRSPLQQTKAEIIKMQQGKQQILKIQPAPKPGQVNPQSQSFWSKYKWPLIIVGVILYLSSMSAPQKEGEGQGAQGSARR